MPRGGELYPPLFLETVGLELEGVGITTSRMQSIVKRAGVASEAFVTRDASVEARIVEVTGGVQMNNYGSFTSALYHKNGYTSGYEIVTYPLPIDIMGTTVKKITSALENNAENFISPRASFHVHVGFAKSLNLLKKALRVGLALDPLLFCMAGMGYEYRGVVNESTYARPLEGGVAVLTGNHYSHLIPELSLKATNISDFFLNYFMFGRSTRYHPARYFAINLYSILLHGTIEFRHFNQTNNCGWIMSTIELVQAIAELITVITPRDIDTFEEVSVFYMSKFSIQRLLSSLLRLLEKYGIDMQSTSIDSIHEILDLTPVPILSSNPPLTHSQHAFGPETWMVKLKKKPISNGHIDIHNIKRISITDRRF